MPPGKPRKCQPNSAAAAAKSCPTLCNPIVGSPPGSAVPGILQARTLEWVAISFSNAWSEKWKWSRSVLSDPLRPHGLQPTRLLRPWDFPGKSTGAGCHCLLCSLILIYIKTLLVHSSFFCENWYLGTSELHNSRSFVYLCEKRALLKPAGSLNWFLSLIFLSKCFWRPYINVQILRSFSVSKEWVCKSTTHTIN